MGRRLVSKSVRVNATGALLVNESADRVGGAQSGQATVGGSEKTVCVPLNDTSLLADRKRLVLTNFADQIFVGSSDVAENGGYDFRGPSRGDGELPPDLSRYSSRRQLLRGQYLSLPLCDSVPVCLATPGAIELATSLELS